MNRRSPFSLAWRSLLLVGITMGSCLAQTSRWPDKPVHLIVSYNAGGTVDNLARAMAPILSRAWNQPVVVENRPGAGTQLAAEMVAKSAPNGLTFLMTSSGLATSSAIRKKLNYDPVRDLAPVAMLVSAPSVLVAPRDGVARTPRELIAAAKAAPGKYNFGSTGVGSGPQLAMEWLKSIAGIELEHVPYKGDAELFTALTGGEVTVGVLPTQLVLGSVKQGTVIALAVTGPNRYWALPEVPSAVEAGFMDLDYQPWIALFAAGGTPREIVMAVSEETRKVITAPEFIAKYLRPWGADATPLGAEAFATRYVNEINLYKRIVRQANIPQSD